MGSKRIDSTWPRRASVLRLLVTLPVAALLALAAGIGTPAIHAAPSSLVAAYSFDETSGTTVTDSSGNGNTGTIAGATRSTSGKFGGALSFNGSSARVNVPNSASLQLSAGMTLEAWVNASAVTSAWRDVVYKGDDN